MKTFALVCLGGMVASTAFAGSPVPPAYRQNLSTPVSAQLCRAARALVGAASVGEDGPTWTWQKGDALQAPNAAGVVAVALSRVGGECEVKGALEGYARARVAAHEGQKFLYDPEIEALALASQVLSAPRYREAALAAFLARYEGASGKEIVERWLWTRSDKHLVGYDAALAIRAGLAVGETAKAREIADAAAALAPRWSEGADPNGFLTTSRGALLEALAAVDARRYARAGADLMHHLVLTQGRGGSWSARNTQATAYAVRGLAAWQDEAGAAAAERGRRWLRLTQLQSGGWATFNDLMPEPFVGGVVHEVTAEVMLALAQR